MTGVAVQVENFEKASFVKPGYQILGLGFRVQGLGFRV
jgi:hypothetical protein